QSDDNLVEDLTFGGMVHSVEMVAAHRNVLRDLHSNNAQGTALRLTSSHGNTLERVTSGSSRWGVILDRSNDNVVAASRFGGYARVSERGVALDGSSSGNTIRNTETLGWDEHGIAVDGTASGTMLDGNTSYFNDVDGIRIGPDTSDTTIVGNTADDNGEWGIRAFAAVIDGGGNSATGNGLGACDGVVCSAVAPPRGLLVAGSTNPPAGDRPIVSMIEDAGVLLDIVDDDSDLAAIDLLVYDVVFVSTSVVPSKVGATFRGAPVPVMIWEGNLFDEMALSNSGESSQLHTNLVIADAIEPLAGDLPAGSTRVYTDPAPLSFGKPSSDATVIAHEPGRTNRAVLFSYDAGDTLADSAPAPALRVALFPSYAGARSLTATGEQLVAAAIDWVLAGGPPPNDDVADRLPAFVGTTTGDNVGATVEPGERTFLSGLFAESAASVWWEWTSPFDGLARFDTIGSDFRTHLAVGQGAAVDALTVLGAHNGEVEFGSIVAVPVTTGETYLVSVSGMGDIGTGVGDEGDIVLNIREAVPAGNDDFADRVAFVGPTVTGSNVGATLEVEQTPGAGQGGMDGDAQTGSVWWAWTPTVSERIEFDTIGSNFDTILAVWTGDELESLVEVTSNDDCNCSPSNHRVSAVAFDAVAGTTYHVAVYGYRGSSGEIVLNGPA
ncbi:MAG: right-handed parallel beta-helix repeat-containing protein, partial [Actinomycetota bacterium]